MVNDTATENGGKTLQTVFERAKPKKADAQHANNKFSPIMLFMFIAPLVLIVLIFTNSDKLIGGAPPVSAAAAVPTKLSYTKIAPVDLPGLNLPTSSALRAPTPLTIIVPTARPSPTLVPSVVPSPTRRVDVQIVLRSYWPKSGSWGAARMVSGAAPGSVPGAAACPGQFPLGTVFRFEWGDLTCLDRAGLTCSGGTCQLIEYARGDRSGVYAASVLPPSRLFDDVAVTSVKK